MDNTDFRRLVQQTPRNPANGSSTAGTKTGTPPATLGSRQRSAIPMTPRTVRGGIQPDFARQLAERNASTQPQKKFRSSNPKGAKLAEGYQDRTLARNAAGEHDTTSEDDREARLKALEEQVKLGQIEREVFEKLRDQITGGDISATHLVKGLDRQLLERVRRGEDVMSGKDDNKRNDATSKSPDVDADAEFEKLEQQEIAPKQREEVFKRGEMAPPPPVSGVKRSRNDILAELKASRRAAAEAKLLAQPQVGGKFRKFGESKASSRIERDEKGREVLITVDEDGNVKRKVRKVAIEKTPRSDASPQREILKQGKAAKPLGAEVVIPRLPTPPPTKEDDDDDDIFAGVGTAYDPLGAAEDDGASSDEEDAPKVTADVKDKEPGPRHISLSQDDSEPGEVSEPDHTSEPEQASKTEDASKLPQPPQPKKNNYFNDTSSETASINTDAPFADPEILATIRRAAKIREREERESEADNADDKPSTAAQRLLGKRDRDLDDMDMGFGSSRFEDEEGFEDQGKVKLSKWKGLEGDEDDDDDGGKKDKGQRKRGKKKRKGDKNSAGDVLKVIEGRKK